MDTPEVQHQRMRGMYSAHAVWYDATRWAFLFGRKTVVQHLPAHPRQTLLEVGCGTGHNLRYLARAHPGWQLVGLDVSPDMLALSAKATAAFAGRVRLLEQPYGAGVPALPHPVDQVLFSYSLTMFNPGWEAALDQALADLKPGGHIAVVDFHHSSARVFQAWMASYHVRLDGHLLPALEARFEPVFRSIRPAWGGLWRYFLFVGQKTG